MGTLDRHFVKGGATTLILRILGETPMHGYQIVQAIRARSEGIFDFSEGTVYPLLYALEDKGYVKGAWKEAAGERRRKVYALTPKGKRALGRRLAQWAVFARGMGLVTGES